MLLDTTQPKLLNEAELWNALWHIHHILKVRKVKVIVAIKICPNHLNDGLKHMYESQPTSKELFLFQSYGFRDIK